MLTAILIYFPLAAALIVSLLKGKSARVLALFASIVELGLAIYAYSQFQNTADTQFLIDYWWIRDLGISFKVGMDGISLLLVLLTTLLTPLIILSSFNSENERPAIFYGLILLMQMALIGVFTALDAFLFYVFWELALIPIYFICLLWGGEGRGKITLKFFLYTLLGSLLMLVAFIYLYFQTPEAHSFDISAFYNLNLSEDSQTWVFWFIFAAFAIKIPIFPLHTWQPDTYTVSPTQGTMLLSGIMLKMGIYGLLRWLLPIVPQAFQEWSTVVIILCVIGIVYASCIAIVQSDFKRLIAYSSIAHVALIAAGIFSLKIEAVQGAMMQVFAHGVNVIGLFFIVDLLDRRLKTREMKVLGGIRNMAPQMATYFAIVMFGSVALPLTNGFIGEFMLLNGLYQFNAWMAAVGGLTVILGAVYMLSSYQKIMLGNTNTLTATFVEIRGSEKLLLAIVAALVISMGIYPKPLVELCAPAVENLVSQISIIK